MRQLQRWLCTAWVACGAVTTTACERDDDGDDGAGDTTGEPTSTGGSSSGESSSGGASSTFGIDPTLDTSDETGPVSTTFVTTFGSADSEGGDIGIPESSGGSESSSSGESSGGSDSGSSDSGSSSDAG